MHALFPLRPTTVYLRLYYPLVYPRPVSADSVPPLGPPRSADLLRPVPTTPITTPLAPLPYSPLEIKLASLLTLLFTFEAWLSIKLLCSLILFLKYIIS